MLLANTSFLPPDDCLYALQASIPHLTRSSLDRLFQRHEIGLPQIEGEQTRKKLKTNPIGYVHIDIAEVRTEEGKLYMFVAIDRASKFAVVDLHDRATRRNASEFLKLLIEIVPNKIHTVLTDNGVQFTTPGNVASAAKDIRGELIRAHRLELVCDKAGIDHRLTKPNYPWTNGQVERMNRALREATVRRHYYERHDELRNHLTDFLAAYNFAKRLKTSKASRLTSTSANAGQNSQTDSSSIQPTSPRD